MKREKLQTQRNNPAALPWQALARLAVAAAAHCFAQIAEPSHLTMQRRTAKQFASNLN